MTLLDGTLPVRPFHPDGFVGTVEADGQRVRVAALACEQTMPVLLSLVGFDTSVGAVLAQLWSMHEVSFVPASVWQDDWPGPERLARGSDRYKQAVARLEGTREVHALALLRSAHLTEGILHPPDLPAPATSSSDVQEAGEGGQEKGVERYRSVSATPSSSPSSPTTQSAPPKWVSRYVLGNWNETGPARTSFLGHLYALRIPVLHHHASHPEWPAAWAEVLWERGLAHELITPMAALGLHAWKLSGDLLAWSALVGSGVREGWLPWRENS